MLARLFDGRTDGFYVDIGAADPKRSSVTKWFYDLGWSGINVEPNTEMFERLTAARPRDININCGIGEHRGQAEFAEMSFGERSTFDADVRTSSTAEGLTSSVRTVEIRTLNDVLTEHLKGRAIDFLKIDVEGWEKQALLGIDLRRFRPTVMVVEAIEPGTTVDSSSAWEYLILAADYAFVWFDGINRFYLAKERAELSGKFALPPNFFDGFEDWRIAENRETLTNARQKLTAAQASLAHFRQAMKWAAAELTGAMKGQRGGGGEPSAPGEASSAMQVVRQSADVLASARKTARHLFKLIGRGAF